VADIIFGNLPPAWLSSADRLQWVQLDSAGVDSYLPVVRALRGGKVQFTNLRDFYGRAVAEVVLAGILAFYRRLPSLLTAQPQRQWIKSQVEPAIGQLHGARVIILGAGSIGLRIGALLTAFECDVIYYARSSPQARLRTLDELDLALGTRDLVINTLPHTPQTQGLMNRERLGLLPPRAVFVNAGRGSILDETALVELLRNNRLAGAVLDVTQVEPLPPESPLWNLFQVILTQHTGGRFPGETEAKIAVFADNFQRFLQHQPLQNLVDESRGY
jgi:phosphoglycerate dehydrogenase-like enzyme